MGINLKILFILFICLSPSYYLMSQTIAAGSDHIVLLDEDGQVWSFGCGDAEDKLVSTLITNIPRIALLV